MEEKKGKNDMLLIPLKDPPKHAKEEIIEETYELHGPKSTLELGPKLANIYYVLAIVNAH